MAIPVAPRPAPRSVRSSTMEHAADATPTRDVDEGEVPHPAPNRHSARPAASASFSRRVHKKTQRVGWRIRCPSAGSGPSLYLVGAVRPIAVDRAAEADTDCPDLIAAEPRFRQQRREGGFDLFDLGGLRSGSTLKLKGKKGSVSRPIPSWTWCRRFRCPGRWLV